MNKRKIAVAILAAACLPLAACSSEDAKSESGCKQEIQKAYDRVKDNPDEPAAKETPAPCKGYSDKELEKMAEDVMKDEMKDAKDKIGNP